MSDDDYVIPDDALGVLMMGWLAAAVRLPEFPIDLRSVEANYGDDGRVDHVELVTRSGLRYAMRVDFLGDGS